MQSDLAWKGPKVSWRSPRTQRRSIVSCKFENSSSLRLMASWHWTVFWESEAAELFWMAAAETVSRVRPRKVRAVVRTAVVFILGELLELETSAKTGIE